MFIPTSILILCIILNEVLSYQSCKKVKPSEDLDIDWYYETAKNAHYVIATSECQNCEKGDKAWQWLRQRSSPKKFCYRVHGATPEGYFDIDAFCEFPDPTRISGNCAFDFLQYETTITMKGTGTVFLTDNENYIVTSFCIFGKENLWYITSPKPKLEDGMKEKIIAKVVELGFDSNGAVEGVSPVVFKYSIMTECK